MMDGEENRPAFESLPTLTKCDLRSVTILEGLTSCLWYVEKGTTRQSQSEGLISPCFSLSRIHLILVLWVEPSPSLVFPLQSHSATGFLDGSPPPYPLSPRSDNKARKGAVSLALCGWGPASQPRLRGPSWASLAGGGA